MKTNINVLTRLFCFGMVFLLSSGLNAGPDLDTKIQKYVDQYKDLAIAESKRTGIPASIKLAQAVLESRYGTSDLAKKANNHFGIKCKIDWIGETVYAKDDTPSDCFRKYNSTYESFIDHSNFLKDHRLHFYDHLFEIDKRDYKAWASGLQIAGYASTNYYAKTLIYLIEKYEFYQYDNGEKAWALSDGEQMALSEKAQNVYGLQINVPKPQPKEVVEEPTYSRIHVLKNGESMEAIAQQYEVNIDSFYNRNELIFGSQPIEGSVLYLDALTRRKPALKIVFYERTVVGENMASNTVEPNNDKSVSTAMTSETTNLPPDNDFAVSDEQPIYDEEKSTMAESEKQPNQAIETQGANKTVQEQSKPNSPVVEKQATIDNSILDIVVSKNASTDSLGVSNKVQEEKKYTVENIWSNQTEKPKDKGTQ